MCTIITVVIGSFIQIKDGAQCVIAKLKVLFVFYVPRRSNGFEQKRYNRMADKKAVQEAAYKWSVEDM